MQSNKRLTVLFTGYLDGYNPPLASSAILTNFQQLDTGEGEPEAWPEFRTGYWVEDDSPRQEFAFLQPVGACQALKHSDEVALLIMLKQRKPARALLNKGFRLIREIADRPQTGGTIGKQLSAIILYRDQKEITETAYYSDVVSYNSYLPSYIIVVNEQQSYALTDFKIQGGKPEDPKVMTVPKVRKNAPCPCESGKKYKLCHGR